MKYANPTGELTATNSFPDARQDAVWQRIRRQFFMVDGNIVNRPMITGAVAWAYNFVTPEPDASYGVAITPSWNTVVWVNNKTAAGFQANFSVAAPAGGSIDVVMFRSIQ